MLAYAGGSVGTGAFYAFNNFVLPTILKSFGAPDLLIGLLSSTRSIEGALIQPTVGVVSDRAWSVLGRRRLFIAIGVPLSALFFVAGAFTTDLLGLAAVIVLFSIFFNVAVDPYTALLADITPFHQRAFVSGLATAVQLISSVGFLLLVVGASGGGGVPLWIYLAVAAIMLVSFGITVVGIRESKVLAGDHASTAGRLGRRQYLEALLEHRQAMRYLATLFVYQFGLNAILPFLVLYIEVEIHESQQTGFALSAALLVLTALGAIIFGKVADRVGTRPILALGWAMLAASAVAGVVITTLNELLFVVVLAGLGNGAATAVNWPLLTALIPPEKTGVFAGLKAAAESVAIPLSVIVAAELFLPRLGYRGVFAMLAMSIIVALLMLLRLVQVPRAAEAPVTTYTAQAR